MKKAICIVLILTLLSSLTACGMHVNAAGGELLSGEIVLVTDGGDASDSCVARSVWNGISAYAEEMGLTYMRISTVEASKTARIQAIQNGISSEVQLVVCIGPDYETAVFEAQKAHPDVMFLLLDGEPQREDNGIYETTSNTHCILYEETQAGFLAGYAAVKEGYTKLGFCGDRAVPAVIHYGYGFIQGADKAAVSLGMDSGSIEIQYWYAGEEQNPESVTSKMTEWYANGTQLVFASNYGNAQLSKSVIAAAEACDGKVMAADVDRAAKSSTVICSAVKAYETAVKEVLVSLGQNSGHWDAEHAGQTQVLSIKEDGVGLSDAKGSWRLSKFTETEYLTLLQTLKEDGILLEESSSQKLFPAVSCCSINDQGEG